MAENRRKPPAGMRGGVILKRERDLAEMTEAVEQILAGIERARVHYGKTDCGYVSTSSSSSSSISISISTRSTASRTRSSAPQAATTTTG